MRPNLTLQDIVDRMGLAGYEVPKKPFLFAQRAPEPANRINVYDDAIALVTPRALFTFNANTDPSRYRPRMATLRPGTWLYTLGYHHRNDELKRYEALVQANSVTVDRWPDGDPTTADSQTGWFGINVHRGGRTTTGSAGCQTIPPDQYDEFLREVKKAMLAANTNVIRYCLVQI